jgi:GDP-mannose 4,6-dehydratase
MSDPQRKVALITGHHGPGWQLPDRIPAREGVCGARTGEALRRASIRSASITCIRTLTGRRPGSFLHYGDLGDGSALATLLRRIRPDEIYNLGRQSHVRVSFDLPEYTGDVSGLGSVRLLEAVRDAEIMPRFYQASSSELYGGVGGQAQNEQTPFYPRSPYAAAKAYAFYITRNYREAYGMFAVNGILFNHESPRRGETFVTRKITRAIGRMKCGLQDKLYLGNLDARRDWALLATSSRRCG